MPANVTDWSLAFMFLRGIVIVHSMAHLNMYNTIEISCRSCLRTTDQSLKCGSMARTVAMDFMVASAKLVKLMPVRITIGQQQLNLVRSWTRSDFLQRCRPGVRWVGKWTWMAGETNWNTITPDTLFAGKGGIENLLNTGSENGTHTGFRLK